MQRHTLQTFETDSATITVVCVNQEPKSLRGANVNRERVVALFAACTTILPKALAFKSKICASFLQKATENGSFSLRPTLDFCPVVPADSEVFGVVSNGDLEGLQRLLRDGKASTKDCDPEGRSLLSVQLQLLPYVLLDFDAH
jgi:hypothetical protein